MSFGQTLSSWPGLGYSGFIPPDPHGSAGPNGILQVINLQIAYWNKNGTLIWGPVNFSTFFPNTSSLSDPKALYDPGSGRFYVILQDNVGSSASYLRVAVSKNSNPQTSGTADWYFYQLNGTLVENMVAYGIDYPGLGFDGQAIYVTANMYTMPIGPSSSFRKCQVMILNKAAAINGTLSGFNRLLTYEDALFGFTLLPCTVIGGGNPGNVGYFVETPLGAPNYVRIWYVSNPLNPTAFSSTTLLVPDHGGYIEGAPQAGTTQTIPTLSPRTQGNAFWRNGYVWFCHTAGGGSGSSKVYYYKVRLNGFPSFSPTLAESGAINGNPPDSAPPSNIWTYQPAIGANALGDICIVYSQSSPSTYPLIRYTTRRSNGAMFETPVTLKASDSFSNSPRWGDYASVTADPTDNTLWVTHEWSRSSALHDWGTWWGRVQPTAISQAALANGYNGVRNNTDQGISVAVDESLGSSFGSVVVVGETTGSWSGGYNFETVKFDINGDKVWATTYDGPGYGELYSDRPRKIAIDSAGNIYVTGFSYWSGGGGYLLLKYSANGAPSPTWSDIGFGVGVRRYGNSGSPSDLIVKDGYVYVTGEAVAGRAQTDYVTVKYDGATGNQLWAAVYNTPFGDRPDRAKALVVDNSGNVYVTGESDGGFSTLYDYATVKYNSSGVQQWAARYSGPITDSAYAIGVDSGGNVYVTGSTGVMFENPTDFATVKYDANGNQLWVATYDSGASGYDFAKYLAVDFSGNVYVCGNSTTDTTGYDIATVKYSSSGSQLWAARYNGPANDYDDATGFGLDQFGQPYVLGNASGWGVALVKYDGSGNQLWTKRYSRGSAYGDGDGRANVLAVDGSGNAYVAGSETSGASNSRDYMVLKFSPSAP